MQKKGKCDHGTAENNSTPVKAGESNNINRD
jgi:hypothetical protein